MKKITAVLFVLVFALCMPLASCVYNLDDPESQVPESQVPESQVPESQAPVIPDGYAEYTDGNIGFAYPEEWVVNDGSIVIIVNESGAGNNITVSYEQYSDIYSTMTTESFATTLKPVLETAGLSVSGAIVEQVENEASTKITKLSYTATTNGVSMKQTLFICAAGNRNYIVTVTETTSDPDFVNTVFDTFVVK